MEKIRDYDGAVRGYKLGDYYLTKNYYWNNNYQWVINKQGKTTFYMTEHKNYAGVWRTVFTDDDLQSNYELKSAIDNGGYITVFDCKSGKRALVELNNM